MPTLRDVARELGLSASTVSRALNGYPDIKEETRARVDVAARRLNSGLFDAVIPDDYDGALQLTRYLLQLGHRRITLHSPGLLQSSRFPIRSACQGEGDPGDSA